MDATTVPVASRSRSRAASKIRELSRKEYISGILLLLIVVFLWTASNFITQELFVGGYEKPFLVTYLNTSAFALYLVPSGLRYLWSRYHVRITAEITRPRGRMGYQPLATEASDALGSSVPSLRPPSKTRNIPLTTEETARLAFVFCFFWFIANWSVNASLDYTTVASATILSSMSGIFTLGIGRLFHVETLTTAKFIAVGMSFAGVLLVSLSDSVNASEVGHARSLIWGDALALLSAVFYALYVILLKVRIQDESRIDMQLFFGFVGLFNVVTLWPIAIVLHWTGSEPFELPSGGKALTAVLINMAITLSSDYIYVLAMLKTTPLVVTVGLSLTIPLAVIGDFLLNKASSVKVVMGALLVLVSFGVVGVAENEQHEKEREEVLPPEDAVVSLRTSEELTGHGTV